MKRIFLKILVLALLPCCAKISAFKEKSLSTEMIRLGIDTALIVNSNAIDEYPLWSPDSNFVAANVMGKWYKFDLTKVRLSEAEWHQKKIGILAKNSDLQLGQSEQEEFRRKLKYDMRSVVTNDGDRIEIISEKLSTALIVTKKGDGSKKIWTTNLENCHSLSVSPNEEYVAYLCELNGLFVMKIR